MTQTITKTQVVQLDVRKLAGDVLLLAWNGEESAARGLRAMAGGEMIRPPVSHTAVPLGGGRIRNLMAVRLAGADAAAISVCDSAGHTLAETGNQTYGRSRTPDLDPAGLLAGFDNAARVRAVRFLTDVCGSIFQLGANAEFIANCRHLVGEVSRNPGALLARCTVLDRHVLCTGVVKAAMGERLTAVVVGAGGVRRATHNPVLLPGLAAKQGLAAFAVLLDKAAAVAGTNVVILAENGMACRQIGEAPAAPPVLEWLLAARADVAPARRYLLDCLARLSAQDPHAASLLRELQVLGAQGGRVVNEKCPISAGADLMLATSAGVFVTGWLRDPHGIVETIEIETQDQSIRVPVEQLLRFAHREADLRRSVAPSDIYSGFATFAASSKSDTGSCRMALRLRSGGRIAVAEGPSLMTPAEARDAVLAAIPQDHVDADAVAPCIEPALAALRETAGSAGPAPKVIDIGKVVDAPVASLIVPMSNDIDIVRCRTGLFATDPGMAEVEVIYVLDQAQHRAGTERLLRALHTAYGTPMRLVIGRDPCDSGAALNAAAKIAKAPLLAFLGRGVLPDSANWLDALTDFLDARPRCGLVGTRLMLEDHSLAAAGAEFAPDVHGQWDAKRLYQGFPCDFDAAAEAAPVAALPFGCLATRRSMFELAGGFAEDYFTTLRQAADLAARIRSHGFEIWRASEPMLFDFGTEERIAPRDIRAELDRRLLEQRWREAVSAAAQAGDQPASTESQSKTRVRTRRRRRAA